MIEESVEELFDLAERAEKKGQDLFSALSAMFSHVPDVSRFWAQMMEEEKQHGTELNTLRGALTKDVLAEPADPSMMIKARAALGFSVEAGLAAVTTLEDAYQLACEFEYAEINELFSYLLRKFSPQEGWQRAVLARLKKHVMQVTDFFQGLERKERQSLLAQTEVLAEPCVKTGL